QTRAGPKANERPAVKLRGGRHGVVTRPASQSRNGHPASKQWKHRLDCSWKAAGIAFRSSPFAVRPGAGLAFNSFLVTPLAPLGAVYLDWIVCRLRNTNKRSEEREAKSEQRPSDHLLSRQLRADREQDILRCVTFYSHGEPFRTTPVYRSRRSDTSRQEHPLPGHCGNPARAAHHRARAQPVPATVLRRRARGRLPGAVRVPHRAL